MPDWAWVHAELRRPGVTLALLWQEYRLSHPQGFQYSWFCEHYRLWAAKVDVVMRQEHRAGEKLFVDYAGQTVPVIDRLSCLFLSLFHWPLSGVIVLSPHLSPHTHAA